MKTLPQVESALAWAAQQTYYHAKEAAEEYGNEYGREMYLRDAYHNAWSWRNKGEA
jgi:hypothetical protein